MRRVFAYLMGRFYEARHRRALDAYIASPNPTPRDCARITRLERKAEKFYNAIGLHR